jgi:hypothetical protein
VKGMGAGDRGWGEGNGGRKGHWGKGWGGVGGVDATELDINKGRRFINAVVD